MTSKITERMWPFLLIFLFSIFSHALADLQISHTMIRKSPEQNLVVMCNDTDGREITWSGPKGVYTASTKPSVQISQALGTSLIFLPLTKGDGGNYTCRTDKDSKTFRLILDNPVTFVDTPTKVIAKEYQRVFIRCEAKADETPIMNWSPYDPSKHQKLGDGFVINNATREDTGNYTCQATLPSTGSVAIIKIALIVQYKPSPRNPENWMHRELVFGFIGGSVDLICDVDGVPPPTFEWHKNRERLNKDPSMLNMSTLTVNIENEEFFGNFTCKTRNSLGVLTKHFILKEGVQPPPPDSIEGIAENGDVIVLGIRGPNVTDRVDIPPNMNPVGYRIEYRPVLEKDADDEQDDRGEGEEEVPWDFVDFEQFTPDGRYPLYNLTDDTEYEIRVATINKAGLSVFSNITNFKTMKRNGKSAATVLCSQLLLMTFVLSFGWFLDQ